MLPTRAGQIEILPGHAHLLAELEAGLMRVKSAQAGVALALGPGFVQVDGDTIRVLTDMAARPDDVDVADVQQEIATLTASNTTGNLSAGEIAQNNQKISFARAKLLAAEHKSGQ